MQRLQAYQFELMPDGRQASLMRRFAGACRFVFNKALALQLRECVGGNEAFFEKAFENGGCGHRKNGLSGLSCGELDASLALRETMSLWLILGHGEE